MPGIESFGRRTPTSHSAETILITPDELSNVLFLKVLADAPTVLDSYNNRFKQSPTFQANRFERQKFIYLVAGVANALTLATQKQSAIVEVIAAFRSRVRLTMQQSWGDTEEDSDSEIEESASDYAKLVFTDPEKDKGLSFDWAREWLRRIGIEETNPITLFEISHEWKLCHIYTLKLLSSMQVVDPKLSEPQPNDKDRQSPKAKALKEQLAKVKHSQATLDSMLHHSVSNPALETDVSFARLRRLKAKSSGSEIVQKDLPEDKQEATKSLTVDEAAEALFVLMRKDFNKEWLSRLATVSDLDLRRAETELVFLDVFATYFSLKFTRSPGWRDKGILVFEKLFNLISSWLGNAWESINAGTRDDAFKVIDERLKAYAAAIEEPTSANPDEMLHAIGSTFALFAFAHEGIGDPGSRERDAHYEEFLTKLLLDHRNIVIAVASEVFNHRMQSLYGMFDSYKLS
jgi:hypothetical protein